MKTEHISEAMNLISDDVIEETDAVRHSKMEREEKNPEKKTPEKKNRGKIRWQWAGAAACLAVMTYASIKLLPPPETPDNLIQPGNSSQPGDSSKQDNPNQSANPNQPDNSSQPGDLSKQDNPNQSANPKQPDNSPQPIDLPQLPMLTVSGTTTAAGGGGIWVYDISEYVNANPWREDAGLTTLPVFSYPLGLYIDPQTCDPIVERVDPDKMRELLLDVAGRFGLDTDTLTVTDDAPDEEKRQKIIERFNGTVPDGYLDPTWLMIETDSLEIKVDQTLTADITFKSTIALPDTYNFHYYASYEEVSAVAEYLKTEYKDVLQFDDPRINIHGGDYNIYLKQSYYFDFFDAGGSDVEQIVNYNFNRITFSYDLDGKLRWARIYRPDLSGKVGDYPIITLEAAKELLSRGNYIVNVSDEMPGMEYVKKAELVYSPNYIDPYGTFQYIMPYYRFYVEIPEREQKNGLKTYISYYVPAVRGEYISDMPVWDGTIHQF